MNHKFIIRHTDLLLNALINRDKSVAYVTKSYFKANKGIGSKERQIISDLTFFSLRNYFLIDEINKLFFTFKADNSFILSALSLICIDFDKLTLEKINYQLIKISGAGSFHDFFCSIILNYSHDNGLFNKISDFISSLKSRLKSYDINALALFYSVNVDIVKSLSQLFDFEKVEEYLIGLNHISKVQIRVNTLKTNNIELINSLGNYIDKKSVLASDTALTLTERFNPSQLPEYNNGDFEIQSDGSQLISLLAYQKQFNSILDACAGAGGKSLHLAALSNNLTEITAIDIDSRKIEELRKRALRAGVTSIKSYTLSYFKKSTFANSTFDLVLVDAPCSAIGTSQRDPSKKLFLNKKKIINYQNYQKSILDYYSKFVNNQGFLVYATCSILPEENEQVVENFLIENDAFDLFEPNETLNYYNLRDKLSSSKRGFYRVHPLHNSTDGFFIAILQKKG